MQENHPLTIVCGADNKFSMPLAVTLFSALANLESPLAIDLYIIDGGISVHNKIRITKAIEQSGKEFRLHWVPFDLTEMTSVRQTKYISKATYLRILVPDLLPRKVTKVIYLDCDLIVEANLMHLWQIDMEEKAAMGVQDFSFPYVSSPSAVCNFSSLNLPPHTPYCNAGVLVINLSYWREHDFVRRIFDYLNEKGNALKHNDQEGINVVIGGNWHLLDPRWNVTLSSINCFGKELNAADNTINFYKDQFRSNPFVIHFTSRHKPWHTGSGNKEALNSFYYDQPYFNRFFFYLRKSRWFNPFRFQFWLQRRKAVLALEYKLPRKLSLLRSRKLKTVQN
ncbi:MAG: glycosyltransferase family 8 protein [Chitinophagaceae bacterium]|nr:MAG: glycosyltransferase family 8 protein [Chitinophagaceae bacterium]